MRTEKALKNIIVSLIGSVFLFVVGLIVRRLLLESFDLELVGYDGLLSDMFAYIVLADLGVGGLFNYRLYKAFATDKKKLNKLVSLYRVLYISLGFVILFICFILLFLLPVIFKDRVHQWHYFYTMYGLYALQAASSYFFGYWRAVLVADQKEHKAVEIETFMSFLGLISKVAVLLTSKDYITYLVISVGINILSRIIVTIVARNSYPFIQREKVTFKDFENEGMLKDSKNLVGITVGETVTWSSVNLLITLLISVEASAFYYNYALIGSTLYTVIIKLVSPITASVADMVYKEEKEVSRGLYNTLDLAFFFLASILFTGYVCVFQNTISFMFGEEYLLTMAFVFVYGLQYYTATRSEFIACFRNSFGEFDIERRFALSGSAVGIITSVVLSRYLGIVGIVIGIIIALLFTMYCRMIIVIKNFFNDSLFDAILNELKYLLCVVVEIIILYFITRNMPYTLINLIIRIVLSVLMPVAFNIMIFSRTDEFRRMISIVKDLIETKILKRKTVENE